MKALPVRKQKKARVRWDRSYRSKSEGLQWNKLNILYQNVLYAYTCIIDER